MHPRVRLALAVAMIVAAGALAAVVVGARPEPERRESPAGFEGSLMPPGVPMPEFTLRDQDGELVRSRDLIGRPLVVTFVYAGCTESCGPQLQFIRGALDDVGRDVPVIAVSAKPESDTPSRARAFLLEQKMTGRARFLLGSPKDLAPVYEGFFVQPQTEEQEHHARVVLVDARGMQRVGYNLANSTSDNLVHDLRLLEEAS